MDIGKCVAQEDVEYSKEKDSEDSSDSRDAEYEYVKDGESGDHEDGHHSLKWTTTNGVGMEGKVYSITFKHQYPTGMTSVHVKSSSDEYDHEDDYIEGPDCNPNIVFGNQPESDDGLIVMKTADPYYTRTYTWDVTKAADPTQVSLLDGESADITYTVEVTRNEGTDSDFGVMGKITISNSGTSAVEIASVDDVISGGIVAEVTCPVGPFPYTLAANSELECAYDATLDDKLQRTNTVTVTLMNQDTFNASAEIIFGEPTTEVDAGVDAYDVFDGGDTGTAKRR